MPSKAVSRRAVSVCCVVLLFVIGVGLVAALSTAQPPPQTPIDSSPDDTDIEDGRVVPSERIPFGIRTVYGTDDPPLPSGGAGITVAVVDSGVDIEHPDLQNRVTLCRDFTGDRVRNRCIDTNGHGTHVAGTVAADGGDDGLGIYGVAPEAELYAFKACDGEGRCGADALASAVRAATDEGADVIVLSLGGASEPRIQTATQYATDNDVAVIASSGNSGPELESILYPAAHPNVISVGAVGPQREETVTADAYRAPRFSGRGTDAPYNETADGSLDIAAVGVDVLSPIPGEDYGTKTGTSMAAPHVAGLAAKILGGAPESMTVSELRTELHDRAPRYDVANGEHAREGYDPAAGFGVPTVSEPRPAFTVSPDIPVSDEPFILSGARSRSDSPIREYAWDTTVDGEFDRAGERLELQKPPGTHSVTLRVTDAEDATATTTQDIFVNDRPRLQVVIPDVRAGENATLEAVVDNEFGETTVTWTLPNGETTTGEMATYRFDPGDSTVHASVTDEFGASTAETVTVTASPEDQGPVIAPVFVALLVLFAVATAVLKRR